MLAVAFSFKIELLAKQSMVMNGRKSLNREKVPFFDIQNILLDIMLFTELRKPADTGIPGFSAREFVPTEL